MRRMKTVSGIALTLCYAAGLIAMIAGQTGLGLMLWVISTLGGMGFLWYCRNQENGQKDEPPA